MEAPLSEALISPPMNARLLLVSSQARPPSSQASFQKACMNFTASIDPLLSMAVLAPRSVSMPPKFHSSGVAQGLAVGVALLLQLGGDRPELVVGLGEGGRADLVEPGLPVGDEAGDDA